MHRTAIDQRSLRVRLLLASAAFLAVQCPEGLAEGASPAAEEPAYTVTPLREGVYRETWIDFNKNGQLDVYEDPAKPIDERVDDLLSQMTLDEKSCQLATLYGYQRVVKQDLPDESWSSAVWKDGIANIDEHINGLPGWRGKKESKYVWPPSEHARAINEVQKWFIENTRLGVPVDFTNEGIRGICHHKGTNFPAQVAVGASWNTTLAEKIGRVTGAEAKALGYTHIYSPILDLARDPRWGRVVECYGEDPFLVSALGLAQVQGLREAGVGSTCKHYAVYSVPKGGRDGEARTDPHVAEREMQLMYLKPFEYVIRHGDIQGVMSSYNDYDGVPVSGSRYMLQHHLRERMGFTGYVVSDSRAVAFLHQKHRVADSLKDAARLFLEAGGNVRTEFNNPRNFVEAVRQSVQEGDLSTEVLDARVADVLRVKFVLGLFDRPFVEDIEASNGVVHSAEHQALALQAAREGMVLLKNEAQTLPLSKDIGAILVCGPNADAVGPSISRYGPTMGDVVTVLEGVRDAVSPSTQVLYAEGCKVIDDRWPESEIFPAPPAGRDKELIEEAVRKAQDADVIVAVMGESEYTIGESKSRTDLDLTGHQLALVQALHETGKPLVVVLQNGRALSINWIDRHVPAILGAWFPGEACGTAIAEALFGDYNPGGKLPVTFPRTVGQVPFNFPFKPSSQAGQGKGHNPNGVGNSRVEGALYPFGFGLSYTEFAYSGLEIAPERITPGQPVDVTCTVTNTGAVAGDEVVQLYLHDQAASVIPYERTLCGFKRVHLQPGESKTIRFTIDAEAMEILDLSMERVVEPGGFTVYVASSSEDFRLEGEFQVMKTSIARSP